MLGNAHVPQPDVQRQLRKYRKVTGTLSVRVQGESLLEGKSQPLINFEP